MAFSCPLDKIPIYYRFLDLFTKVAIRNVRYLCAKQEKIKLFLIFFGGKCVIRENGKFKFSLLTTTLFPWIVRMLCALKQNDKYSRNACFMYLEVFIGRPIRLVWEPTLRGTRRCGYRAASKHSWSSAWFEIHAQMLWELSGRALTRVLRYKVKTHANKKRYLKRLQMACAKRDPSATTALCELLLLWVLGFQFPKTQILTPFTNLAYFYHLLPFWKNLYMIFVWKTTIFPVIYKLSLRFPLVQVDIRENGNFIFTRLHLCVSCRYYPLQQQITHG